MAEKTEGRRLFEMAMDAEFGIELANQMGPYGRSSIDPSRASVLHYARPSGGTLGFYTPNSFNLEKLPEDIITLLRTSEQNSGVKVPREKDRVYVKAPYANNFVWAHEFRHRANPFLSEDINRFWDAWRARTPDQWAQAVHGYRGIQAATKGIFLSFEEAERELEEKLEENKNDMLTLEVGAMIEQNMAVPNGLDHRSYLEEQYQQRKLARRWRTSNTND